MIMKKVIKDWSFAMDNETHVKQEGNNSTIRRWGGHHYNNYNTVNKSTFNGNIKDLEGAVFTQGHPPDAEEYEDYIKVLVNYVQSNYSPGVYLVQVMWYGNVPYLSLLNKTNKKYNQLDARFGMKIFKWKKTVNTVIGTRSNIKLGKKTLLAVHQPMKGVTKDKTKED